MIAYIILNFWYDDEFDDMYLYFWKLFELLDI